MAYRTERQWWYGNKVEGLGKWISLCLAHSIYLFNVRTDSVCSRVVPANSSFKMLARFLPLLMRMHNEYLNNPDQLFNFIINFYSREPSGNHSSRSGTTNTIWKRDRVEVSRTFLSRTFQRFNRYESCAARMNCKRFIGLQSCGLLLCLWISSVRKTAKFNGPIASMHEKSK